MLDKLIKNIIKDHGEVLIAKYLPVVLNMAADAFVNFVDDSFAFLKTKLFGKKMVILGATATGKDSLIAKLRGASLPRHHSQTTASETVNSHTLTWRFSSKELQMKTSKSINVGGEPDKRERDWLDASHDADIILYLIDAGKLQEKPKETLERFEEDLEWLNKVSKSLKENYKIAFVFNKIDLLLGDEGAMLEEVANNIQQIDNVVCQYIGNRHYAGTFPLSLKNTYLYERCSVGILNGISNKI